ncbi:MAG: hypothetical protein CMK56_04910 [Proteobacteria bacterium]|nr:hypothetical protein [Pseudomonadota bacterium]
MAMVINSNIASLTAQRALGESQKMQQTAMERLSTGQRINSAADDAAGMAIAEGFTSQIKGLGQAVRNANEALSLSATAESGLQETTDILQRIRELALQASNSTLTTSDRTAITNEVTALTAEIDRIATSTQYNNSNILDGSASNLAFQIGDRSSQHVSFSIDSAKSSDLGLGSGSASSSGLIVGGKVQGLATLEYDDVLINGVTLAADSTSMTSSTVVGADGAQIARTYSTATAIGTATAINSNSDQHGVVATASTSFSGDSGTGVTTDLVLTFAGFTAQGFEVRATTSMADLALALDGLDEDISVSLNARGGLDYFDALGRTVTFSGTSHLVNTGFAASANTGHVFLSSVDGSSDITIGGDRSDMFDTVEPVANAQTTGVGERISAAAALGLNYGSYSYSGGTTVETGQLGQTVLANTDTLTINGVKLGATTPNQTATNISASDIAAVFNAVSDQSGVTAVAKNEAVFAMNMSTDTNTDAASAGTLVINGITTGLTSEQTLASLVASLNNDHQTADTGLVFTSSGTQLTITSDSGSTIRVTDSATTNMFVGAVAKDGDELDAAGATTTPAASEVYRFRGFLELSNTSGDVVLGTTATNDDAYTTAETLAANLGLELSKKSDVVSGGSGLDLSTATGASAAIASIDSALEAVNTIRGNLGAMSNRLEYTVSNLTTTIENHSASRSRIVDADFATESAALAKAQVLAQASTAMLAQANAAPQLALQLLQ